jgi:hypothetical protein
MAYGVEPMLGLPDPALDLEIAVEERGRLENNSLVEMGFLTVWECQSQLATFAFIFLVAFMPIFVVLAIMLCWSIVATVAYHRARSNGLPDLLATRWGCPDAVGQTRLSWLGLATVSSLKIWFAGLQPFLYSRLLCNVLIRPVNSWPIRAARYSVLGLGFTLFGVTTCRHLLERAGHSNESILRASLLGPLLNVPYRVLVSAAVVNAAAGLIAFWPA